jgi:hypothetical protein
MKMESSAVLGKGWACSHVGGVHRNEEVAPGTDGKAIGEFNPDWPVLLSHDGGSEITVCG